MAVVSPINERFGFDLSLTDFRKVIHPIEQLRKDGLGGFDFKNIESATPFG
jgi:hypothetical protein